MTLPPKIYIIILQYNNSQDTIGCLSSVSKISYPDFKAIIIDNASNPEHSDNIKSWINSQANLHGRLSLVSNSLNSGYSGGNNLGIKVALENGADYILILNNDTIVKSDLLDKLIKTAQSNPQIGIVSPLINEWDKIVYGGWVRWLQPQLSHVENFLPTVMPTADLPKGWTDFPKGEKFKYFDISIYQSVLYIENYKYYIPGVCMLIKKEVFEKVGLLDEKYFLYFEDADYSIRVQKAGFKLAITPDAMIYHRVSSSTKKLGAPQLLYYHYRNALYFNLKNGPWYIKLLVWPWSLAIAAKQALKISLKINPEHSRAILKGIGDFYRINYPLRGKSNSG